MTPAPRSPSPASSRSMRAINIAIAGAGIACSLAAVAGTIIH